MASANLLFQLDCLAVIIEGHLSSANFQFGTISFQQVLALLHELLVEPLDEVFEVRYVCSDGLIHTPRYIVQRLLPFDLLRGSTASYIADRRP